MKTLFLTTLSLVLMSQVQAGTNMKIEGTCSGTLFDGTAVSYTYYSNYDGCRNISNAAVSFTTGFEGLYTGKRSFTETQDIYQLNSGYKLVFANSTGNTTGKLIYPSELNHRKVRTVQVQCEVRDYEYSEC